MDENKFIHVRDNIYLSYDVSNWILNRKTVGKKGKSEGIEKYSAFKFFPTLEIFSRYLVEWFTKDGLDGADSMADILPAIKQAKEEVKQLLEKAEGLDESN